MLQPYIWFLVLLAFVIVNAVGMLVFNTNGSGKITVHSEVPSGITWTRCWVSLEDVQQGSAPVPVLTSSA